MLATETTAQESVDERVLYEFAYHVLPTVAEGEVTDVVASIKRFITDAEGEVTDEEMPERVDLEYPIVKYIEGKNRKFTSAYFGWVRFALEPGALEGLIEGLHHETRILRDLMIRLSKREEAHPFRYHEHKRAGKREETIPAEEDTESIASDEGSETEDTETETIE